MATILKTTLMRGAFILALISLSACSSLSPKEQRMLSGGAIGASSGAVLGTIVGGNPVAGAAIGGALGTAAGAYWKDIQKQTK